jgi:hypothetical protein
MVHAAGQGRGRYVIIGFFSLLSLSLSLSLSFTKQCLLENAYLQTPQICTDIYCAV